MSQTQNTCETILDQLADGASFKDLNAKFGYTRDDFLQAALYGVAELQAEYIELLKTHGKFTGLNGIE